MDRGNLSPIDIELQCKLMVVSWPLELAPFGLELSRVNPGNSYHINLIVSQIGVGFRIEPNVEYE
jgi:hypothetical protein